MRNSGRTCFLIFTAIHACFLPKTLYFSIYKVHSGSQFNSDTCIPYTFKYTYIKQPRRHCTLLPYSLFNAELFTKLSIYSHRCFISITAMTTLITLNNQLSIPYSHNTLHNSSLFIYQMINSIICIFLHDLLKRKTSVLHTPFLAQSYIVLHKFYTFLPLLPFQLQFCQTLSQEY